MGGGSPCFKSGQSLLPRPESLMAVNGVEGRGASFPARSMGRGEGLRKQIKTSKIKKEGKKGNL